MAGAGDKGEFDYVVILDGSGNVVGTFGGSGGTAMVDDDPYTAAASSFTPVGGIVTADSVDAGDGGAFAMLANRQQKVTLYDSGGNELSVGGGTQHATNDAYSDADIGTAALTVRDDALTTLTEADGDYSTLRVDSTGSLWARLTNTTLAVTQSGTWDEVGINDSGNSITVDAVNLDIRDLVNTDVVTAELSATDNAVLDAIAASVAAIDTDATTIIGHVDGIEGLLTTIDGDTGNIVTSVQLLDDAVYVDDADWTDDTSKHLLVGGVYQGTPHTVTDGDVTPFLTDANGRMAVAVNGTVAVSNAGLTELAAAINASSQMDVNVAANGIGLLTTAAHDAAFGTAGTADAQVRTIQGIASMTPVQVSQATAATLNMTEASAANILTAVQLIDDGVYTDDTSTHSTGTSKGYGIMGVATPTDASVNANDFGHIGMTTDRRMHVEASIAATQTLSTVTTVGTVTTLTGGGVAHDSGDSGNPHKVGGKAIDIGTQPTAVTANDRTDWYFNRNGVPWVLGGSPATLTKELDITDADGAQTDTAVITVASGTAIIVTMVQAYCDKANTVDVGFRMGFGTANTPAADAAGIIAGHPGIAAGSGVVVGNGGGVVGMGASNEDLRVTCEDPVSGSIRFIVTYHTILIG